MAKDATVSSVGIIFSVGYRSMDRSGKTFFHRVYAPDYIKVGLNGSL